MRFSPEKQFKLHFGPNWQWASHHISLLIVNLRYKYATYAHFDRNDGEENWNNCLSVMSSQSVAEERLKPYVRRVYCMAQNNHCVALMNWFIVFRELCCWLKRNHITKNWWVREPYFRQSTVMDESIDGQMKWKDKGKIWKYLWKFKRFKLACNK